MAANPSFGVELSHVIGFEGKLQNSVAFNSETDMLITVCGACPVISSISEPSQQHFLRGHKKSISFITVSSNFSFIATSETNADAPDIIIWDVKSRSIKFRIEEHLSGIACMAFSQDERFLVTIGDTIDGKLIVWDMKSSQIVGMAGIGGKSINAVVWGGRRLDIKKRATTDFLFSTVGKNDATLWCLTPSTGDLAQQKCIIPIKREYNCVSFSEDGVLLLAGSKSGDISVLSTLNFKLVTCINSILRGSIEVMRVCSDGLLIVAGRDGEVISLKRHSNNPMEKLFYVEVSRSKQLRGCITGISLSTDEVELVVGTSESMVYRMRRATFDHLPVLTCPFDNIWDAAFHRSDSLRFATCGTDSMVRVWNLSNQQCVCETKIDNIDVRSLVISDLYIIVGCSDGVIRSFNRENAQPTWKINDAHKGSITALALSPNEKFLVSGGSDGSMRVWSLRTRQLLQHQKDHLHAVNNLVLLEDRYCLSCSRDRTFSCWDLKKEQRICSYAQRMGGINAITIVDDGSEKIVITTGQEKSLSFWDMQGSAPIHQIKVDTEFNSIETSHDGKLIACGGVDHKLYLWEYQTRKLIGSFSSHSCSINKVQFSPDDRQIISVGSDSAISIWNVYDLTADLQNEN